MNIISEWTNMSNIKKVSFLSAVVTICGFFLSLYSEDASSLTQNINGSPKNVIGENNGTMIINQNEQIADSKGYVLRNSSVGVSLVLSEPDLMVLQDESKQVCNAISGTPISLTGRSVSSNNVPIWREVKIEAGDCSGKVGWVSSSLVSYE